MEGILNRINNKMIQETLCMLKVKIIRMIHETKSMLKVKIEIQKVKVKILEAPIRIIIVRDRKGEMNVNLVPGAQVNLRKQIKEEVINMMMEMTPDAQVRKMYVEFVYYL